MSAVLWQRGRVAQIAILALLLPACYPMTCGSGEAAGPYGVYYAKHKRLVTCSRKAYDVYRVKTWHFGDGSPSALQLEYRAPFSVEDSVSAREQARAIWPVFGRYAVARGFRWAIITATDVDETTRSVYSKVSGRSLNLRVFQTSAGSWTLGKNDTLPAISSCSVGGIFEYDGTRFEASEVSTP